MTLKASILPNGRTQFLNNAGAPVAGGSVGYYIPTTMTPKDTWQNSEETVLNLNPVELDAAGSALIWGVGAYRMILKDSTGATIYDVVTYSPGAAAGGAGFGELTAIVSDTTTDLGSVASHNALITGGTPIVSFGSTAEVSAPIWLVKMDSSCLVIASASLLMPQSRSYPFKANDSFLCEYLGGGIWRIVAIWPAASSAFGPTPQMFGAYGDGLSHKITVQDIIDHPEWVGTYPVGTEWDMVGTQEAIYAAFATASTPGNPVWNAVTDVPSSNQGLWIPNGTYLINRQLLMLASGFVLSFENRRGATWTWTGDKNTAMFKTNAVSYGEVHRMHLTSSVVMDAPLWDMDWDGAYNTLKTQQLSLYDINLDGAFLCRHGIRISHNGGGAQGDTIAIFNPIASGLLSDWLRPEGANALDINVYLGDVQGCCQDGICAAPGAVKVWGLHGENQALYLNFWPAYNQIINDGASVHIIGAPGGNPSDIRGMREEGDIAVLAENGAPCRASEVATLSASYTPAYRDYSFHPGHIIAGGGIGTHNKTFVCVSNTQLAPFSHPNAKAGLVIEWTLSQGWTPGAFIGKTAYYRFPNGFTSHILITANTDRTLTLDTDPGDPLSAGLLVAVGGRTAAGPAPDFDTCPTGYSTYRGAVGHGFTYSGAGNDLTVDATVYGNINVGDYIIVPRQNLFATGVATDRDFICALITKVTVKSGGDTLTVVDAPANGAFTDVYGFYGNTLADGDVLWMELDFDTITGVSKGDQIYAPYGRTRYCGDLHVKTFRTPNDIFGRSDVRNGGGVDGSVQLLSSPQLLNPTELRTVSGVVSLAATQEVCDCATAMIVDDTTFAAEVPLARVFQRFTLVLKTSGVVSRTVTFGTNFLSAGPLATGVVDGKFFVIEFIGEGTAWLEVSRTGAL